MTIGQDNVPKSFGMFKPVGHVLSSFRDDATAQKAATAFAAAGFDPSNIHFLPAAEVVKQASNDIDNVGILASIGQELNLVKAQLTLAQRGHGFVAVRATDQDSAKRIALIANDFGADRAQRYGRFVIEEMLEPGTGEKQVSESPSNGLDAQTKSGIEASR